MNQNEYESLVLKRAQVYFKSLIVFGENNPQKLINVGSSFISGVDFRETDTSSAFKFDVAISFKADNIVVERAIISQHFIDFEMADFKLVFSRNCIDYEALGVVTEHYVAFSNGPQGHEGVKGRKVPILEGNSLARSVRMLSRLHETALESRLVTFDKTP